MRPTAASITRLWRGRWRGNRRRIAIVAIVAGGAITITTTAIAMSASSPAGTRRPPATATAAPGTARTGQPGTTSPATAGTSGRLGAVPAASDVPAAVDAQAGHHDGAKPSGRITLEQLTSVPVDLPAWGNPMSFDFPECPTKGVRLNHSNAEWKPEVIQLDYGDVDHDGAVETVARLDCPVYQAARQQVVAFDRNAAGAIVALGQVIRQDHGSGSIQMIYMFTIDDRTGGVRVQVGDRMPCCGASDTLAEHQWRTYTWDGKAFRQTGGPTAFHPVPASYGKPTVTMTPLTFGPSVGGERTGETTLTITNPGPDAAPGVRVEFQIAASDGSDVPSTVRITARGATCAMGQTTSRGEGLVCHHPSLAGGATFTVAVTVTSPVANDGVLSTGYVDARVSPEQPGIRVLTSWYEGSSVRSTLSIAA